MVKQSARETRMESGHENIHTRLKGIKYKKKQMNKAAIAKLHLQGKTS